MSGVSRRIEYLIFGVVLLVYGFFFSQSINLITADLGRHIKNGEVIWQTNLVPETNLYSYTYPDFEFVNHHWGSGLIFYLISTLGGFEGLSLLFVFGNCLSVGILFWIGWKNGSPMSALIAAIVMLPLIIYRTEIRPEFFSYLLMAVYFLILYQFRDRKVVLWSLYALPVLQLLWVNLHIYFFFGLLMLGIFTLDQIWSNWRDKKIIFNSWVLHLGIVLGLSGLACLVNPFWLKGALYPSQIFNNYGYRLLENQNLFFLERLINFPVGIYFKLAIVMFVLGWVWYLRQIILRKAKFDLALSLLSIVFVGLGIMAVRNFSMTGLFLMPILAIITKDFQIKSSVETRRFLKPAALVSAVLLILVLNGDYWTTRQSQGFGLMSGVDSSAKFYLDNKISGPIFNNYDIGGYLIYYLYPTQRIFVDNRPEAYPASFFKDIYIPMQQDDQKWREIDQLYGFNSIFFYRLDLTPWAQRFLVARIKDLHWVPVYVDQVTIIFVRRVERNSDVIKKYELPKEMFKIS